MEDVDVNPFGDHESRPAEPTGENIPLTPREGSTWEPEQEQETSFGISLREKIGLKDCIICYLKKQGKTHKHFIWTCLKSEMGNCIIKAKAIP